MNSTNGTTAAGGSMTGKDRDRYVTDDHSPPPSKIRKDAAGLIKVEPLRHEALQPSYAQDLGLGNVEHGCYGSMINGLGSIMGTMGSVPCCICCPNGYKSVKQGSVGLVRRFGQFYKSVDPGLAYINPLTETLKIVDVMIQIAMIPRQTVMTRDNVNLEVDSVIYFHIVNPYKATFGITDVRMALIERAQTTLRQVVGSRVLQSVITEREAIALEIEEIVEGVSEKWGVSIESILIKDIIFSHELQQSLSSAAQQKRIGESKVIAARAEVDSAKLMREAADILSSPAAMQIRQLDTLQSMAKSAGSKVIFVPMSLQSMGTVQSMAEGEHNNEMTKGAGLLSGMSEM